MKHTGRRAEPTRANKRTFGPDPGQWALHSVTGQGAPIRTSTTSAQGMHPEVMRPQTVHIPGLRLSRSRSPRRLPLVRSRSLSRSRERDRDRERLRARAPLPPSRRCTMPHAANKSGINGNNRFYPAHTRAGTHISTKRSTEGRSRAVVGVCMDHPHRHPSPRPGLTSTSLSRARSPMYDLLRMAASSSATNPTVPARGSDERGGGGA